MNIKEAKNQIKNTLRAYLMKDELGNYVIPSIRQRPVLLMGPPGIGKTQIMEQIATEENVGLVAYTITHHTRQSAIGLPFIEKRVYDGVEYNVTEYTMSEIIGAVRALMERTGIREGILFLDEINCVSETLSPMMLQFLQVKTFGNQKLPEGWMIVAAGNPPEYNRSVRDFDIVTLDRVKRINVSEDYGVWREYAVAKGLHGAVISYLDTKRENFYSIGSGADGLQFATARGWEDLSEIIRTFEKLGTDVGEETVVQYIQLPSIARDFANYLALYNKYRQVYHIEDILNGTWPAVAETEFKTAAFDEKLAVLNLMYSRIAESAGKAKNQDELTQALFNDLSEVKTRLEAESAEDVLAEITEKKQAVLKSESDAGHGSPEKKKALQREIAALGQCLAKLRSSACTDSTEAMDILRDIFSTVREKAEAAAAETGKKMDNAFSFLDRTAGQSRETVFFVTDISAGSDTSWYVEQFGCDAYFKNNSELLFEDRRKKIIDKILSV